MAERHAPDHQTAEVELVAYLDGELDTQAVAAIERRLTQDAEFRQQLAQLQESWKLLDLLETPQVSAAFTHTTLEMTVVAARDDAEHLGAGGLRRHLTTWCSAIMGCGVSVAAGFVLVSLLLQQPDRKLLRDLPVIENVDDYTYGDDIEFIRLLLERGVFATEPIVSVPLSSTTESLADRRQRVASLSVDAKERLQSQQIRFATLSAEERADVRDFHNALVNDEQAAELQLVLAKYNDWLKSLSTADRYQVLRLDDEARIQRVQALQRETESQQLNEVVQEKMSPEDSRRIFLWMNEIWKQREPLVVAAMSPKQRDDYGQARTPFERRRIMMATVRRLPELQQVNQEELQRLADRLSPGGQAIVAKMIETGDKPALNQWFRDVNELHMRFRGLGQNPISDRELMRFFVQLPTEEQTRLRNLPAHQMWSQVRLRYIARKRRQEYGRGPLDRGGPPRKPKQRPPRVGL